MYNFMEASDINRLIYYFYRLEEASCENVWYGYQIFSKDHDFRDDANTG